VNVTSLPFNPYVSSQNFLKKEFYSNDYTFLSLHPLNPTSNQHSIPMTFPKRSLSSSSSGTGGNSTWVHPSNQVPPPSGEHLELYGNDLTKMAEEGKLDPVIGRHDEIRRTLQILARRSKNNPVLIGEPGVGKVCHSFIYDKLYSTIGITFYKLYFYHLFSLSLDCYCGRISSSVSTVPKNSLLIRLYFFIM